MADTLQPIYTPFSAGIDTQAHPHNIRTPYLRHAQNVDYRRDIGPQKREGLTSLSREVLGGGSIANGGQLLTVGDEMLCADDQAVYSWSPQNQRWVARGELRPVAAETRPLAVSGAQVTATSCAGVPALGIDGCAWIDTVGVHVAVVDTATGTRIISDLLAPSGRTGCRLVATSSTLVLFTMDASGNVYSGEVQVGAAALGPDIMVASNVQGGSQAFYDVAYDPAADGIILAYAPAGAGTYNLRLLRSSGAPYGVLNATSEATGRGANLGTTATLLTLAVGTATGFTGEASRTITVTRAITGSGTGYYGFQAEWYRGPVSAPVGSATWLCPASGTGSLPGQALSIATQQLDTAGPRLQTFCTCAITDPLLPGYVLTHQVVSTLLTPAGTVGTPTPLFSGLRLLSRPFTFGPNARTVAWCISSTLAIDTLAPVQPAAFLMDLGSRTFCATLATGNLDVATLLGGVQLQAPYQRASGQWACAALIRTRRVTGQSGTPTSGLGSTLKPQSGAFLLLATAVSGSALQAASLDGTGVFAGGITYMYDGADVVEQGFFEAPVLVVNSSSSGGSVATGTYLYSAAWEWYDARGRRHRSAPSVPVSYTNSIANAQIFASVTPLRLTRKKNVALVIYRSTANGVVLYQVTDSTNPYLNNPAVNFLFPVDTLPDSAILGNEPLYTGGGELPNDAPPASTVAIRARSRILLAGGEYRDTITYSKQNDIGNGVQFSLGLQKRIAAVPGDIVALAAIDDKVIVFKTQGICAFAGTGVTSAGVAAGNNDDFSDPIIVSTDLFCTAPNSVVTTSEGTYFQSQKGIYLLDRGLNVAYVGAGVEGFNAQSVTSAQMQPARGHIRFGCSQPTALIYHPRKVMPFGDSVAQAGAWTTYTNYAQVSATVWQGRYAMLRADGTVCLESATFDDDGRQVVQSLRTGWLTGTAALQAAKFGALAVIGELTSPHRLQVDLAISYDPTPVARLVFDTDVSATRSAWGSDPSWGNAAGWGQDTVGTYMFRARALPEQVMTASAVQWTFTDAPSGGGILQRSASLHGYAMLVEPLVALASLPDKQSL